MVGRGREPWLSFYAVARGASNPGDGKETVRCSKTPDDSPVPLYPIGWEPRADRSIRD